MDKDKVNPEVEDDLGQKRKKILLITAIIVLLLIFLFWVLKTSNDTFIDNENTNIEPPIFTPPSTQLEYKTPEIPLENSIEFSVTNLAKTYTARFGSWSTDNQGNNIQELLPLSTTKMQTYLNNIEFDFNGGEFKGITTKSLSAKILSMDDDRANVVVNTQKIETNENLDKNVYYQEAEVEMINSGDQWLVDQFVWKD